ncbi:alpha/beta hydrolase family protein [Alkalihalobacillus sp. R86527]|uniref:alpha/beta hydrolase family protein n=1 Tax=Alkalihalobacillus sp. R86527 TaxID=3093863 RepID=UPI00366D3460
MEKLFYGNDENQFGELRIPEGDGPHPVAVVIHGGFWREPFKLDQMRNVAEALTAKGIATWNIEYRRVSDRGRSWPDTLTDAAKACDHLYSLKEKYTLDLSKVITIGHSAGGHLATWLAARHKISSESPLYSDQPLPIAGVISLAGVTDLEMMHDVHEYRDETLSLAPNNPTADLIGGSPKEFPERYKHASPIELLPLDVHQVLIHGALDIHVPIGISSQYHREAQESGDFVKLVELPQAEHFMLTNTTSSAWELVMEEVELLFLSIQ